MAKGKPKKKKEETFKLDDSVLYQTTKQDFEKMMKRRKGK
jgi:hypothetical protein